VIDGTPFGDRASIVYVGRLLQSRVLPIAWRIMPLQEQWDQGQWELVGELLDAVSLHLQPTDCTIIADRGLAGWPLVKLCCDRKFHSLLRVCKEHTCRRWMGGGWTWWCALQHIGSRQRPAVVWAGLALAGENHRDVSECYLG